MHIFDICTTLCSWSRTFTQQFEYFTRQKRFLIWSRVGRDWNSKKEVRGNITYISSADRWTKYSVWVAYCYGLRSKPSNTNLLWCVNGPPIQYKLFYKQHVFDFFSTLIKKLNLVFWISGEANLNWKVNHEIQLCFDECTDQQYNTSYFTSSMFWFFFILRKKSILSFEFLEKQT